jgi:adenylosuccinate synthase
MKMSLGGWFKHPGAYVLVDGQFGSTGKGLLASYIACHGAGRITHVTTNAGPNSGHTAYDGDFKVMTQQIPVASVFLHRLGQPAITFINAGAVVDPQILDAEIETYGLNRGDIYVHPRAALIDEYCRIEDKVTLDKIASTGKGTGPAIMRKIARLDSKNVASQQYMPFYPAGAIWSWDAPWNWTKDKVFVETAQGFSLGINSRFYPHVTSRECTVMQAIADARIPPQAVRKVVCCFRTFPIRVGNTSGSSGDCYNDQIETTWEELGLEPEFTTVTKRLRRVFTWSRTQFRECIATNRPDAIFLNFANYLSDSALCHLVDKIKDDYHDVMGYSPETLLLGFGPKINDITTYSDWWGGKNG